MSPANQPRYTIIDEADEMVSPDWMDDMRKIMGGGGRGSMAFVVHAPRS
jgi:hypothetical protein